MTAIKSMIILFLFALKCEFNYSQIDTTIYIGVKNQKHYFELKINSLDTILNERFSSSDKIVKMNKQLKEIKYSNDSLTIWLIDKENGTYNKNNYFKATWIINKNDTINYNLISQYWEGDSYYKYVCHVKCSIYRNRYIDVFISPKDTIIYLEHYFDKSMKRITDQLIDLYYQQDTLILTLLKKQHGCKKNKSIKIRWVFSKKKYHDKNLNERDLVKSSENYEILEKKKIVNMTF